MSLSEYWRIHGRRLTRQAELALGDLTDDQWHWAAGGSSNSIAFVAWHYFRTEDNIINWIIQERRPTVWMDGQYAERLHLPPVAQGTGMAIEDARALRIPDVQVFLEYVRAVRARTDAFLETWDPSDYNTPITLKPVGEMTKLEALAQQGFAHGFGHIGEIQHIRALLGLRGIGL